MEFHDPTLRIGKVFGQESTVVKYNNVFFLQKDDVTNRFRFSPSSDANWCLTEKFKSRNSSQDLGVYFEKGRENLNLKFDLN